MSSWRKWKRRPGNEAASGKDLRLSCQGCEEREQQVQLAVRQPVQQREDLLVHLISGHDLLPLFSIDCSLIYYFLPLL